MRREHSFFIEQMLLILAFAVTSCLKVPSDDCDKPAPDAITDPASFISSEGAILNGRFSAHGQTTGVTFEFGTTDQFGQSVEPLSAPVSQISFRTVSIEISGLKPETTYHFRLKATGECLEASGEDLSFTTLKTGETGIVFNPAIVYGSVRDIDENIYKTVQIGTQTWMAENLRVQRFNDATGLVQEVNNHSWTTKTDPAYCYYANNISMRYTTGALYNWHAVGTGKLCPAGWHVPSESEWNTMIDFLGGEAAAASRLKMTDGVLWPFPNSGSTNESGFTAIPVGIRYGYAGSNGGLFYDMGWKGVWWTSTQSSVSTAKYREIDQAGVISGTTSKPGKYQLNNKNFGFSVRCVKD